MKIRRHKKVNKHMNFYVNNFSFRKPYQLLIDGTFCLAALKNQINIADNIPRYLQSELKLLTTQCMVIEMESFGHKLTGAAIILKQFAIHKCGHEGKPVTGSECMLSMLGKNNENHYITVTQDRQLQDDVRKIPAAPLLYLVQKTPVLDPPSQSSINYSNNRYDIALKVEKELVKNLKEQNGIVTDDNCTKFKKKKKKGANPLSCKKKKTKPQQTINKSKDSTKEEVEKTRRKKVRIAKHVKEMMTIGNK